MTERRGPTVLHFTKGELVRAERAFLSGAEHAGAGVEARRLDLADPLSETAGRPLAEQVWARPVGAHIWGRGRLQLQPERAVFVDEPKADPKRRGDQPGRTKSRLSGGPSARGPSSFASLGRRTSFRTTGLWLFVGLAPL